PTSSTSGTLATLNTAIAQAADDPTLSRGLTTYANLNRLKTAQSNQAALATSFASLAYSDAEPYGYFPQTWPTTTRSGTPCQQVPGDCVMYGRFLTSAQDIVQQEKIFNDAADASQKQLYRDSTAGKKLADFEKQITDTGTVAQAALTDQNAFVTSTGVIGTIRSPRIAVNPTTAQFNPLKSPDLVTASLDQLDSLKNTENSIITSVLSDAQSVRSDAQQTALLFAIGAIGAILVALIIAFYVARAVTVPLKKLTSAAYTLSTDKLPALVERLRNPDEAVGSLSETLTPIDIRSKDEIGQLADAFNSIQHVTVEVAEEQGALLRKGIGDIFINLARRNQTLLDRQIEFIDQLEANEEDPDQLDNLFKLDHLATRMRRNAESLLVLAGAEPPRRRGRPVALADVVRVAIGEVEDFARISLLALDDVTVGGNVAVDLAHLLSELMENATHFSPPDTTVEIVGHRSDEGYTLSVSDQGIGMSADQLAEANSQLARPPLVGLALSRSLGFIVIGRLASRFGVTVKLTSSSSGGVTALVTLPGELVTVDGQPMVAPPVEDAPVDTTPVDDVIVVDPETDAAVAADGAAGRDLELEEFEQTLAQSDFEAEVASLEAEPVVDEIEVVAEVDQLDTVDDGLAELAELEELTEEPGTFLDAVPDGDDFERGLQSLVSDELAPGPVEGAPGSAPTEPALSDDDSVPGAFGSATVEEAPAPLVEEAPVAPEETTAAPTAAAAPTTVEAKADEVAELTAAGLVRRTPKKRSADATGGGMPVMAARATGASQRSPEEVRKMLSRYRSGLNKGRGSADGSDTEAPES
ncbi:MAG: ATP-binding protein, partial [Acidimicrobiales bacterium]